MPLEVAAGVEHRVRLLRHLRKWEGQELTERRELLLDVGP